MTELNDELLVAYVDGQLATAQSKAVERVLEEDEVAAERVAALRSANEHLEVAFEALIAGQSIPSLQLEERAAPQQKGLRSRLIRSAAFAWVGAGCLLAGTAIGFTFYDTIAATPPSTVATVQTQAQPTPLPVVVTQSQETTWAGDMIAIHGFLSPQTFALGKESEGNLDLTSFQLSKAIGTDFVVPDLSAEKLTFQRAQLLQRDGKPFGQIAYIDPAGEPLALYVRARAGETEPMRLGDHDGLGFVVWTQDDLSLTLIGRLKEDRLGQIARVVEGGLVGRKSETIDTGVPLPEKLPEGIVGGEPAEAETPTTSSGQ